VTVNTERDGSFGTRLYPDTYRARVSAPGFRGVTENVVVATGMAPVRFVLSRGEEERRLATLNLRVVERVESRQRLPFRPQTGLFATRPVPNAEVRIVIGRDVASSGQTDAQGVYSTDLQPGSYTILVAKQGYDAARQQVLLTQRGETTEIVLAQSTQVTPQQKRLLTLRVVEQVVKPLQTDQQQQQQQQQPDRRPRLQTTPRLRQSTPGASSSGQPSVSPNDKENLLTQNAQRSPLQQLQDRFRQRLDRGRDTTGQSSQQVIQPVLGATVSIFQGRSEVDRGQTDRDGMYRVQLDPGSYVMRVSRAGFDTAQQSVVIADRDVTRQVVLRRQQQRGPN
jgi:Carboxypeptidase regulatory-like domain